MSSRSNAFGGTRSECACREWGEMRDRFAPGQRSPRHFGAGGPERTDARVGPQQTVERTHGVLVRRKGHDLRAAVPVAERAQLGDAGQVRIRPGPESIEERPYRRGVGPHSVEQRLRGGRLRDQQLREGELHGAITGAPRPQVAIRRVAAAFERGGQRDRPFEPPPERRT